MSKPTLVSSQNMPDVARRVMGEAQTSLDWVGMSHVHQPLLVKDGENSKSVQAKVQVYVNLADPMAKGIHMSRLYLILDEHAETRPLTAAGLKLLLGSILESHHDLSTNAFVQFEAERQPHKTLAGEIIRELMSGKAFRSFCDVGLTVETSSLQCEAELKGILAWVKKRKAPLSVVLTHGRFQDSERRRVQARAQADDVCRTGDEADTAFESQCRFLMKNAEWLHPILAARSIRGVAHALAWADEYDVPDAATEIQLMFGAEDRLAQLLTESGRRVRILCPVGPDLITLSRLARHQLENRHDATYLQSTISESTSVETLLMKPGSQPDDESVDQEIESFVHEPRTNFSVAEHREAMTQALVDAKDEFGQTYPLVIDGKSSESRSTVSSRNPSATKEIVGHVAAASADQAADAVEGAKRTFTQWAASETSNRCEYVELIAAEIRERRFELAAWVCLEVGMTWEDADAEVATAIDYCMFYASQMRELDVPQEYDLSGEENRYSYRPCGVAVVIGSWRSPLASLTGTLAAAIVTGNTVVLKPAEQASVIAARLMSVVRNAGVPDGVVNFLPGIGEDICPELVGSPDVQLICFNGNYESGTEINRLAAGRLQKSIDDHTEIVDAIASGDEAEASRRMLAHLQYGRQFLLGIDEHGSF